MLFQLASWCCVLGLLGGTISPAVVRQVADDAIDRAPGPPTPVSQDARICLLVAGVTGDADLPGCPGSIKLLAFQHDADRKTLAGAPTPGTTTIETPFGRHSVPMRELFKARTLIPSLQLKFFRATETGQEEEYFQIILHDALISDVSDRMSVVTSHDDDERVSYERYTLEARSISYVDVANNASSTLP